MSHPQPVSFEQGFFTVFAVAGIIALLLVLTQKEFLYVHTTLPSSVTSTSMVTGGEIVDEVVSYIAHGVCFGTSSPPTIKGSKTDGGPGDSKGLYVVTLENLKPNTLYYLRAYITTSKKTYYGEVTSITTKE